MTERKADTGCGVTAWAIAALAGGVVFVLLMFMGGWSFLQAAFAGGILFVVAGLFFMYAFCRPLPGPGEVRIEPSDAESSVARGAAPSAAPAVAPPIEAAPEPEPEPEPEPVAQAPQPEPEPEPAPEPVRAEPAPEPVRAEAAPAASDGEAVAPALLSEARPGGADDLKLIRGVGPKLEATLHRMGVFHYDQIASWTDREVAWVDDNLEGFRGRVSRDEWVAQARVLAAGGSTEFSRRATEGEGG